MEPDKRVKLIGEMQCWLSDNGLFSFRRLESHAEESEPEWADALRIAGVRRIMFQYCESRRHMMHARYNEHVGRL